MPEPRFAGGLSAFADRYDAFVLDQWGVLHDGANPYPGAIAAVEELVRRDKKVALLSNSGRRAAKNRERMATFGFDPAWFAAIVTSGETWQTPEDLRPIAEAGTAHGLPLVCSNPDIVAVSPGQLLHAPGAFARIY